MEQKKNTISELNDNDRLKQVIVVDDGLPFRVMMKKIIEMYFYAEVHVASNPQEAFKLVPTVLPHLIILDMQMPIMDGYTALRHFRTMKETKNTPVIAFSALGNTNLVAELVKWKISDYIKKPSTTEVIVQKISPFLPLRRDL